MLQAEAPQLLAPHAPLQSLPRRIVAVASWPLVAILAVQTCFSLALVWSNTAFTDEANYLRQGHLEWAHWLHGYAIPAFPDSGAPQIYPPLGALADSIGGLVGARILSLCFMLGGTVLLYLTASRLFGTRAAIIASALWALSEPVLRLAFATYDPMSVFLVTLSAWLALQASLRRRCGLLVAASAAALTLASVTAFSYAIMIPPVMAFALLVWSETMGTRRAWWRVAWLLTGTIALSAGIATVLNLWRVATVVTVTRYGIGVGQGVTLVARSAWSWDGFMLALAAIGVVAALAGERQGSRKLLLLMLAATGLLVPLYQAHLGTGFSLDKHMSACSWFLAMAAGYGVAKMTANVRWKPPAAASIAVTFLAFPAVTGLWYAKDTFHSWPNTSALVARVEPLLNATTRPLVVGGDVGVILQYATPQGHNWARWHAGGTPTDFSAGRFGLVILELSSTLNSPHLPREAVIGGAQNLSAEILRLSTSTSSTTGEFATVRDVVQSRHYQLQDVIPFTTSRPATRRGLFVVWKRVG